MKITMNQTMVGAANQFGNASQEYVEGQTYDMEMPWQNDLAQIFVDNGWATEAGKKKTQKKVDAPTEAKRARNDDGTLKADDPATPENEAWEGAKAPKKTTKKKS